MFSVAIRLPMGLLFSVFIFCATVNLLLTVISLTFNPLCALPVVSTNKLCRTINALDHSASLWNSLPLLLRAQADGLSQLLNETKSATAIALDLTEVQLATRDLVAMVQSSDLTSRSALADLLMDHAHDAQAASRYIGRLVATVQSGADQYVTLLCCLPGH